MQSSAIDDEALRIACAWILYREVENQGLTSSSDDPTFGRSQSWVAAVLVVLIVEECLMLRRPMLMGFGLEEVCEMLSNLTRATNMTAEDLHEAIVAVDPRGHALSMVRQPGFAAMLCDDAERHTRRTAPTAFQCGTQP